MATSTATIPSGMSSNTEETGLADDRADPISAFAERLLANVENVIADLDPPSMSFSFGPLIVEFRIVADVYRRRLTQAIEFARFLEPSLIDSAWRIMAVDGAVNGVGTPPEWRFRITNSRHLERLHQTDDQQLSIRYDPTTLTWSAVFRARRLAFVWTANAAQLPDWDDSAPCRDLFNWMTLSTECFLAHAATIGINGKGVLLTGPSGSGKSTTAAAAALSGLVTTGDDFILVDPRSAQAYALYDSLKLDSRSSEWLPEMASHAVNAVGEASPKCRVHLARSYPLAFVRRLPINAILLPRTDRAAKTTISPATAAEAMRALVPSTICLVRGGEAETIRKSASFVRKMPAYHCDLGPNPREAVAIISAFITNLPT
jgi:hypothetical protein